MLQKEHSRIHSRALMKGALPVFVAACISRGVSAVFAAISSDIDSQISLNCLYALLSICVGYCVLFRVEMSHVRFCPISTRCSTFRFVMNFFTIAVI